MHVVQMPKRDSNIMVIPTPTNIARGHRPHRGGVGTHADRRTKRLNTRSANFRQAIKE